MKYDAIENIKIDGKFLKAICFKPKIAPFIISIIGILLLLINNILARLLGLFFIVMAIFVLYKVKDFKVLDIFDNGVLIYGDKDNKTGLFINYDDLKQWGINHDNGHDTIEFILNNDEKIIKDTFEANRAYRVLYQLLREKEAKYIRAQKNKELNFNIPDALNNIKNQYKK